MILTFLWRRDIIAVEVMSCVLMSSFARLLKDVLFN